jgi:hypothetical protein
MSNGYPVLSKYSSLIYRMISEHLRPIEAHMDTELQTLGWCAGIEHEMQYWSRSMLEEVVDERIRERLLSAWDNRQKVRDRESEAYHETEMLEKDPGTADTDTAAGTFEEELRILMQRYGVLVWRSDTFNEDGYAGSTYRFQGEDVYIPIEDLEDK